MQTFTAIDRNTNGANTPNANTSDVVAATNAFLATLTLTPRPKWCTS